MNAAVIGASRQISVARVPVTDSVKQAYAEAYRAEYKRTPERFEGSVESLFDGEYVSHLPAYVQLRQDGAGHLWLSQWRLPYSSDSARMEIYSTRGVHVARIAFPADARIADIRGDRIALIATDSLGIETVRVHDIIRRP